MNVNWTRPYQMMTEIPWILWNLFEISGMFSCFELYALSTAPNDAQQNSFSSDSNQLKHWNHVKLRWSLTPSEFLPQVKHCVAFSPNLLNFVVLSHNWILWVLILFNLHTIMFGILSKKHFCSAQTLINLHHQQMVLSNIPNCLVIENKNSIAWSRFSAMFNFVHQFWLHLLSQYCSWLKCEYKFTTEKCKLVQLHSDHYCWTHLKWKSVEF